MYLLDTNAVLELRKLPTGRPNAGVAAWSATVRPSDLHVSVITLQELAQGVLMMEHRNPVQGAILRRWLNGQVVPGFRDRALSIDAATALRCANLYVPDGRPALGALISATGHAQGDGLPPRGGLPPQPLDVRAGSGPPRCSSRRAAARQRRLGRLATARAALSRPERAARGAPYTPTAPHANAPPDPKGPKP